MEQRAPWEIGVQTPASRPLGRQTGRTGSRAAASVDRGPPDDFIAGRAAAAGTGLLREQQLGLQVTEVELQ